MADAKEVFTNWIVFPATHDKITDKKFLRKGIESLFTTVDPWKG